MGKLKEWQANRTLAYVAPLFLFMAFLPLVGAFTIKNSKFPWWQHSPEHWLYPIQCLCCGAVLLFFRKHYQFGPYRGFGFATFAALLGIAVWILPTYLFDLWQWDEDTMPKWLHWLGFQEREDSGFDPSFIKSPMWYGFTVAARLFRMVVIVALVEEVFWRGFLMRYLVDIDGDFWKVKFGTFTRLSVSVTVIAFTFAHSPADYMGAIIYGSLACWVAIRTKSLAACVWMHALANLILGIFILLTKNWGLW
ncbi:MAG: CAAX prenyl protease-like protein [Verrucomicrobiales bacterium]|jgi:CAAX prenyl protease-like protein